MNVLVAYATKHGATREIADAIADELRRAGHDARARPVADVTDLEGIDAIVVGSAVYMKRWRRDARRFLHSHRDALAAMPLWVFSSGPCGENPDPSWSEPARTIAEVEHLGAVEHVVFGGRLPLEPDNFVERAMVRDTPEEARDQRDWEQIRAWAAGIAAHLAGAGSRAVAGA
jgi:menaquinone-dependent protoporphyrinogen oxidase